MVQAPQRTSGKREILIILLFSLLLNVLGIWFGLPSHNGWAPDEILPRDVQDGIARRFSPDWYHKYPPLHYYLLALVEAPIVFFAKIRELPLDGLSVYSILIFAGRFLSLFMAAGIVFLVYKCGLEILDPMASLLAAGISSLLIPLVYYSKTANADVPFLIWFMGSLYFFLRILRTRRRKYYLLFALTAVLAVCAKDQAYGLYIIPPLVVLWFDWKIQKKAAPNLTIFRFLSNRNYLFALAVAVCTFFLVHNLAFNFQGFLDHIKMITGPLSQDSKLVSHTLSGHIYLLGRAWGQIRFSLGWPLFLVCLAGVIKALLAKPRNTFLLSLLAFVVSYEIFLIHVILYNYSRFYLPLLLILSLFGGQFLAFVLQVHTRISTVFRVAVAVIFVYSILYAASLDVFMIKDARYAAEKWMRQNIPKEATIGLATWRAFAPRVEDYRSFGIPRSLTRFQALSSKPDFVIVSTEFSRRFKPDIAGGQFFQKMNQRAETYKIVFRHQTPLSWLPLRHHEVLEQINCINPEIVIYKKVSPSTPQAVGGSPSLSPVEQTD
ncbi:MAG: glycosyltransferase family 39 protein [Candidatus Aminicenantales bacterium]